MKVSEEAKDLIDSAWKLTRSVDTTSPYVLAEISVQLKRIADALEPRPVPIVVTEPVTTVNV